MKRRASSRGAALPIVLLLAAMMLVTASAWLQTSFVAARTALAVQERTRAFHAADSALIRCARMLDAALPATGASAQEPVRWRSKTAFEGASPVAFVPFADWPHARRPPQCVIETWLRAQASADVSYLITARGFGASADSEVWMQLRIDQSSDGALTRHWRRIAGKPF
jgi:Tfp pilus assembly protein PilX